MAEETTKMTLHRALSELKLIDAKIEKKISSMEPLGLYQKDKNIGGFIKADDFTTAATSSYQSVNDLIERKIKIKSAIVKQNCNTMVKIAGKDISIADAITFKSVISFKAELLTHLQREYKKYTGDLNKKNEQVNANAEAILTAALGKDNVKSDSKDVDAIRTPYIKANEYHLSDPLEIAKKMAALETEIGDFASEVDAVLSEINAVTFISI